MYLESIIIKSNPVCKKNLIFKFPSWNHQSVIHIWLIHYSVGHLKVMGKLKRNQYKKKTNSKW